MAHQTKLNRMRLKARSWHRDDTLAELAEDVERLTRLAFPEVTEAMVHGGVGKRPICGCLAGRGHATAHQNPSVSYKVGQTMRLEESESISVVEAVGLAD